MKFAFIEAEKARWPVSFQCAVLGVSCSGYYAWCGRDAPARVLADAVVLDEIKAALARSRGTYGSPRIHRELRAQGRRVSRKRVERLMKQEGLVARRKKRFRRTTDSDHTDPIAPNVLARDFQIEVPNRAWVTDVTYVWTAEGWLFLAVILDLFSRRVVSWSTSAENDCALALSALRQAVEARNPAEGCIHHSDRGSVYASHEYGRALDKMKAQKSMSRKGDCWDNAVAESFFATIKGELIEHLDYKTRSAAIVSIGDYIDGFYNPIRRHSANGYVSPVEYEMMFMSARRDDVTA